MKPTIRILGFRTTYLKRPGSSEPVARDWVKYAPLHDINTVTEEMVHIMKPKEEWADDEDKGLKAGHMATLWAQIEPHYKAYKEGTEVPTHGIPLSAWAGVTTEQADVLRKIGVRTVEEVASMTETQLGKVMLPNARSLKTTAAEYLESRKDTETASKVAALEERNEALTAQLEEMASMIADLRNKGDEEAPQKRGPGRPRKAEVTEEAA